MDVFVINVLNFNELDTAIPLWESRGFVRDGSIQVVYDGRPTTGGLPTGLRYLQAMIKRT